MSIQFEQIQQILVDEKELNAGDPFVLSLLTRIENRIAKLFDEAEQDGERE